ncbi:MAG: penicillin-binding protein activator [Gammaproteobacteria bacterium]
MTYYAPIIVGFKNALRLTALPARWTLAALLILSAVSCAVVQPAGPSSATPALPTAQLRAEQLEAEGDFAGAAQVYLRLAAAANPPLRQSYELSAATAALRAGDVQLARQLIAGIDVQRFDANQRARMQLLDAEIALSEGKPQQTLQVLANLTEPNLPPATQAQIHLLRAEAYVLLNDHLASARERVLVEPWLTNPVAVSDNQNAIVQSLWMLPDPVLRQAGVRPPEVLSGWIELVLIARNTAQDPNRFNEQVINWRQRYRQHPASAQLIAALPGLRNGVVQGPGSPTPVDGAPINSPQRIALLLPTSGSLANVGKAVSEGFMAAANTQSAGSTKPDIRIYDVAASTPTAEVARVLQVYQQAVQEGAEFVVGPLQKEGVKALFTLGPLPVPTLALNYNEDAGGAPFNLYQFGLAPEDEARQVAERAWLDGRARALVLVPKGDRGERIRAAFSNRLEQLGGVVVDAQTYAPKEVDFSGPVRKLLQYSDGGEVNNKKVKPRRRQDVDFIFMAAAPSQGRSIRPMLQFFYASQLPVYATSDVYAAKPNRALDQDLSGVLFVDMPWVLSDNTPQYALRQTLASQHPEAFNKLKRVYALGVDAFNIIPQLNRLHTTADARFEGETGSLSLDEQNRVHRQLAWARFEGGGVRLLDVNATSPVPDANADTTPALITQ